MASDETNKVLVIDDETSIHRLVEDILRYKPYEVLIASTAEQGIQLCDENTPQVAIIDLGLPDRHGLEVIQEIRAKYQYSTVQIVLTGEGMDSGLIQATQAAGSRFYLTKPVPVEDLVDRVEQATIEANDYRNMVFLADHDELTGLYNRRKMMEFLDQEFKRAKRYGGTFAIAIADIDHFKKVNDTYGHPVGDKVLQHVARILDARDTDITARWGGEEFLILYPALSGMSAVQANNRIRRHIENSQIDTGKGIINITLSLGQAAYPNDANELEPLIKKADEALYKAKEDGRNCIYYFEGGQLRRHPLNNPPN